MDSIVFYLTCVSDDTDDGRVIMYVRPSSVLFVQALVCVWLCAWVLVTSAEAIDDDNSNYIREHCCK